MKIVTIPKGWLETCGTGSLEGLLYELGILVPQPVTLEFEREPVSEKGPDLILMPDFVPACLAKSLVHLCGQGYQLEVKEVYRP